MAEDSGHGPTHQPDGAICFEEMLESAYIGNVGRMIAAHFNFFACGMDPRRSQDSVGCISCSLAGLRIFF